MPSAVLGCYLEIAMNLHISSTMSPDDLAERMSGDPLNIAETTAMRAMLVAAAPSYGWQTTSDIEDGDWFRMLDIAAQVDKATLNTRIVGEFKHLNDTEAGFAARAAYASARAAGQSHDQAEIAGSNVLQRHGCGVNQRGGATFEAANF